MGFNLVAHGSVIRGLLFWLELFVWLPCVIGVVQTILLLPISLYIAKLSGHDDLRRVAKISFLWGIGLTVLAQSVWWSFLWATVKTW